MPEDVTDTLAKFTPAGIDRDALLFAAGKAAARPRAGWKWLAAALAATNAVTLAALLWPQQHSVSTPLAAPEVVAPAPPDPPPDPTSYLALIHALDSAPPPIADTGPADQPPPLRAGDLPRFD